MYIGNDLQVAESGNKIIDDISSSFNGSTTSFALLVGGAAPVPFPINTQQIYISVNGVIQEPDPTGSAGFKLLGNNIVFSSAPANGHAFFGVILSGADYVTVGTEFPAGSATAPSITFGNDNNTGLYSVTGGTMGFTSDGAQTFTMDASGFNFPDSKKVNIGSSSDLQIYHDGISKLVDTSGNLHIGTNSFALKRQGLDETMLTGTANGAVEIYYDNTKRFESTSTGTNVIGVHVDDGATHDGDVTFTGAAANVTWDKSADDLIFADNAKAVFGTGGDLEIYHDGTDSYIKDIGTGHLILNTSRLEVKNSASNEVILKGYENGAVELYYDNSKKIQTASHGLDILDNVVFDNGTNAGRDINWVEASDYMRWEDNVKAVFGSSADLEIYHDGNNSFIKDTGTGRLTISTSQLQLTNAADSEVMIKATQDGAVELYYDNSKTFESISGGATVTGQLYVTAELNLINGSTNAHRYIDAGLGDGNTLTIRGTSGGDASHETLATFTRNGAVELYYDTTKRLETTSTGTTTTGKSRIEGGATARTIDVVTTHGSGGEIASFQNSDAGNYGGLVISGGETDRECRLETAFGSSYMTFYTQNASAEGERLRIDPNGNIGLGITNPNLSGYTAPVTSLGHSANGYSVLELTGNKTSNTGTDAPISTIVGYNAGGSSRIAAINFCRYNANNNGAITFNTYSSGVEGERLLIDNTGNVKVNYGNLVIGTSGHGIDFSATSDASGATSELLDDYEEGTFTMHFNVESQSNMSMSGRFGVYTKVGRLVTIHGGGEVSGDPGGQGSSVALEFNNLPFTSMNSGVMNAPGITGTVGFTDLDSTSGMAGTGPWTYHVQFYNNGTTGRIVAQDSATSPVFCNASLILKSTTKISVTLTYMAV